MRLLDLQTHLSFQKNVHNLTRVKMRLINTKTLKLHEFTGSQMADRHYAILSHTWGDEEVTFQDMQNLQTDPNVSAKKGFVKIFHAAGQAALDNLQWLWVDTCCIDKSSSAELSEAINSMYVWYERADVCYAYLADVNSHPPVQEDDTAFCRSRWFTRGWTLQELIAPRHVVFYSRDWKQIGEKAGVMTTRVWNGDGIAIIEKASGIPGKLLSGHWIKEDYSVAQRMSWASRRVCTRVEDMAYCLMGLFNINMPLLYGEEVNAFARLQEEIIKTHDDHSIYAWTVPAGPDKFDQPVLSLQDSLGILDPRPILAPSPAYFGQGANVIATGRELGELSGMTKHGLRISLRLRPLETDLGSNTFERVWAPLNCRLIDSEVPLAILLLKRKSAGDSDTPHLYRISTPGHVLCAKDHSSKSADPMVVYISRGIHRGEESVLMSSSTVIRFQSVPVKVRSKMSSRPQQQYDDHAVSDGSGFAINVLEDNWSYNFGCAPVYHKTHFCLRKPGLDTFLLVGFSVHGEPASAAVVLEGPPTDDLNPREQLEDAEWHCWDKKDRCIMMPDVQVGSTIIRIKISLDIIGLATALKQLYTVSFEFHERSI